jgi:hypothetical protein
LSKKFAIRTEYGIVRSGLSEGMNPRAFSPITSHSQPRPFVAEVFVCPPQAFANSITTCSVVCFVTFISNPRELDETLSGVLQPRVPPPIASCLLSGRGEDLWTRACTSDQLPLRCVEVSCPIRYQPRSRPGAQTRRAREHPMCARDRASAMPSFAGRAPGPRPSRAQRRWRNHRVVPRGRDPGVKCEAR